MSPSSFTPPPFHPNRPTLVAPVRVDPRGITGPTRRQARSSSWRRTSQGFYVPSDTPLSPEQRIVEAAAPMPPAAAITGWAALRWCGAVWFDGRSHHGLQELPVVVASCQDDIRPQPGIDLCQERLNPHDVIEVDGLRVTLPARSVCFEMRYAANVRDAAMYLDLAAYSDLVSIEEATCYALGHPGWTGIPQARDALVLADENAWSPPETPMRLIWVLDAGLPRPLCNRPVFDLNGLHIGTPDIFDPVSGTGGEFDGDWHLSRQQRSIDLRREGLMRRHGLEYFTVLGNELPERRMLAERMAETRRRALSAPPRPRAWTLTPPPWWTESHTVQQRRTLTGRTRDVVLRNRRRVD